MSKYLFPAFNLACNGGCTLTYVLTGDWRRAVYWAACCVITLAVTA